MNSIEINELRLQKRETRGLITDNLTRLKQVENQLDALLREDAHPQVLSAIAHDLVAEAASMVGLTGKLEALRRLEAQLEEAEAEEQKRQQEALGRLNSPDWFEATG